MKVKQISERKSHHDVASTTAQTTLDDVAKTLGAMKIGCLVVLDSAGALCGIISERDIVRAVGEQGSACLTQTVASVMTHNVMTCTPDDSADSILSRMTEGRFRHMPVMHNGRVVALVSIGDMVKAKIEELEKDNEAMETMIRSGVA